MRTFGISLAASRNHARNRPWRTPPRLAVVFAWVMVLGSLLPYTAAASPQAGTSNTASQMQAAGTSSLEIDVVRCPDGFDPNDLFGTCHDSGIEGVTVQVVSNESTLGIDQSQVTAKPTDPGPGRTTFSNLPAGDYTITIGLAPEDGTRYYMYCGIAGGGTAIPANPDNALTTVIAVPDGQAVACDLYVIPTAPAPQSSIDLFAFTCAPETMPESGPHEFTDFQAACTDEAPGVDFHLKTQDGADTVQTTDPDGQSSFTYPAGSPVRFYSGVPLEADEWLFCSVDQGQADLIDIDAQGVSTIDNAAAEARTCSWFLVEPDLDATVIPPGTETPTATVVPTDEPGDDTTIELAAFDCTSDAVTDPDNAGIAAFDEACGDPAPDVDFHLNTGELQFIEPTDANGDVSFTVPSGSAIDFYAGVPLEANEFLFCSLDGGDPDLVEMDDQGVAHFANADPSTLDCNWFLMGDAPATETPTEAPTEQPTAVPTEQPTAMPTEEPSELGQVSVFATTCPEGFDPETEGVDYDTLSANCGQGVDAVSFSFGYPNGDTDMRLTDGQNPIVFADLEPGSYTLFSDVPLEAADEYLYCSADGGDRYQKEPSDRGVATFGDLQSEQITCEWYIVPTSQRGDETGGSLEIHLAACPTDYTGSQIYDTCHGNGLEGYEFTLIGPGGEQTGTTEILHNPGPGVVNFTSLAAGDYTFSGGPPGDFGKVELYCSTQPDNGTPDYSLEDSIGSLSLAENQHVLCDWYFIPEDGSGQTPTPTPSPTPEPSRAEILVTLYSCPPAASQSGTYGGASQETFEHECTDKVNDVTFRLGDPNSAPLSAKTGVSGDGAVRFYDLLPGDLTMTPSLPSNLTSVAVFCTIDKGDPYQKALSNGGTTFIDVDGESIACNWYAVKDRVEPPSGPTGSITIREYLCEKDRSAITDWDSECAPGSTGTSFTIASSASGATAEGTPDAKGVHVFGGLANGFYTLEQDTGTWCRAVADRVDSQSRVIVEGGGNTDVVLYQCNAVKGLPTTGSGPGGTITSDGTGLSGTRLLAIVLGLLALPLAWCGVAQTRKRQRPLPVAPVESQTGPTITAEGRVHMRFR